MDKIRYIFFDRDETLLYLDNSAVKRALAQISDKTGLDFPHVLENYQAWYEETNERIKAHWRSINTKEKEIRFWRESFDILYMMLFDGKTCNIAQKQAMSFFYGKLLYYKLYSVFDDVFDTLESLKAMGLKMGVISDTLPMLKESLDHFGLGSYFDSFTAAADIGVLKPSPLIFGRAVDSLDAVSEHSIYIDDRPEKMEGIEKLGIKAFLIDRLNAYPDSPDRIDSLARIIDYVRTQNQ